jgi:cation diffusion facilitator family transporter
MVFEIWTFAVLAVSILIKLWMYSYNRYINNTIDASINRATAWDSMSDVLATSAVVVGGIIGRFVSIPVDGILGVVISLFIIYTGFRIAKDSVNLILGSSPDPEMMKKINDFVLNGKNVVGVHDLIIHDYGPGRCIASAHAEVSDDTELIEAHAEVDEIEQYIEKELGINIVIHIDPVNEKPHGNTKE